MSDTPKTDAKEKAYWSNPTSHVDDVWTWAQELERENAALRERLDSVQKSHFTLSKDNAALRTLLKRWLKVADDCHQEQQQVGYSEYNITVGLVCDTRALLDAARKEAQP